MKATKLTPKERELFEALKSTEGGKLRQHIKPSNTVCFRLLDNKLNPVQNVRFGLVMQLRDKDIIELSGHDWVLKATSDNSDQYKNIGLVKEAV
jgi:hypothetical protein